ncbi:hypothetical protein ACLKA7_010760 [Drosophila subpalustris]
MQLQTEIVRKPNTFDNCSTFVAMKATGSSSSSSAASSSNHLEPLAGGSTINTITTITSSSSKARLPKVSFAPLDVAAPSAAT